MVALFGTTLDFLQSNVFYIVLFIGTFLIFLLSWYLGLMTSATTSSDGAVGRHGDAKNNHNEDNDNDLSHADKLTGHCNTFRIAVESVPRLFDTIVLSRFPDSLRDRTQRYTDSTYNYIYKVRAMYFNIPLFNQ